MDLMQEKYLKYKIKYLSLKNMNGDFADKDLEDAKIKYLNLKNSNIQQDGSGPWGAICDFTSKICTPLTDKLTCKTYYSKPCEGDTCPACNCVCDKSYQFESYQKLLEFLEKLSCLTEYRDTILYEIMKVKDSVDDYPEFVKLILSISIRPNVKLFIKAFMGQDSFTGQSLLKHLFNEDVRKAVEKLLEEPFIGYLTPGDYWMELSKLLELLFCMGTIPGIGGYIKPKLAELPVEFVLLTKIMDQKKSFPEYYQNICESDKDTRYCPIQPTTNKSSPDKPIIQKFTGLFKKRTRPTSEPKSENKEAVDKSKFSDTFDEKLYKSIYDFLVEPTGNTKPILPPAVLMILSMKLNHLAIIKPYYEKNSYDRMWELSKKEPSEQVPPGGYTHKQPIQPWSIYDMLSQYVFYYTKPTNCGIEMEKNASSDDKGGEGGKEGRKPFVTTLLNRFKATSTKTVVKVADITLSIGITDLSNALCKKKHLNWSMLNKPLLLLQKGVVKHFGKNLLLQTLAPLTAFLPVEIGYFKLIFGKRFEIYRSAEHELNIWYADQSIRYKEITGNSIKSKNKKIEYKEPFVETPDDIYEYLSKYYEIKKKEQDKKENKQKYIKYKIKYLNLKDLNDQQDGGWWPFGSKCKIPEKPNLTSEDLKKCIAKNELSGKDLRNANLENAKLKELDLTKTNLTKANLSGAVLQNLYKANLSKANLTKATLIKANLSNATLMDADLTGADLEGADLTDANLKDANLTGANLSKAILTGANLLRANLTDADLTGANLSKANLTVANLLRANLRSLVYKDFEQNTNLKNADLTGANLEGADLTGVDINKVNNICTTIVNKDTILTVPCTNFETINYQGYLDKCPIAGFAENSNPKYKK